MGDSLAAESVGYAAHAFIICDRDCNIIAIRP